MSVPDGGAGFDLVSYQNAIANLYIDLTNASPQAAGEYGTDTFVSVEGVFGGDGDDTLLGDAQGNYFYDLYGANSLSGLDGNDTIVGSGVVDGGAGNDMLTGIGSRFIDVAGATLSGGLGDDWIDGLWYGRVSGDEGNDTLAAQGHSTLAGGLGDDVFNIHYDNSLFSGGNLIDGGAGSDIIFYSGRSSRLSVKTDHSGVTYVQHFNGKYPSGGADTVTGVEYIQFTDRLIDLRVGETTAGTSRGEYVEGGIWSDSLSGLAGEDSLYGGVGGDTLDGGAGGDTMVGGVGDDTYRVDSLADVVVESEGEGVDTVQASISLTIGANVENLVLATAGNINGTGNGLSNTINGNSGANQIRGLGGDDSISASNGTDTVTGGAGADTLAGGGGADRFVYAGASDSGVSARDLITDFTSGSDKIDLSGIDAISGGADNAFTLVAAFSKAAGQLTANWVVDHYEVAGDVNGDATADFIINVVGAAAPTVADFIL